MIRTTLTAAALALCSLVAPVAQADTAKNTWCALHRMHRTSKAIPRQEIFDCSFSQHKGTAYVKSTRWAFAFPTAEEGKSYKRDKSVGFVRFIRPEKYILTVWQDG